MTGSERGERDTDAAGVQEFDAVVVGAGFAGLYMLYRRTSSSSWPSR